jgi:hypothetical protein
MSIKDWPQTNSQGNSGKVLEKGAPEICLYAQSTITPSESVCCTILESRVCRRLFSLSGEDMEGKLIGC